MSSHDTPELENVQRKPSATAEMQGEAFKENAADGFVLGGFTWRHALPAIQRPVVIINAATSVRCRHYSRFAAYLFANGFDVITYDYRGIGESRPGSMKGLHASWTDWGVLDFEAMLKRAQREFPGQPIDVVGHSFGGCAAGLGESGQVIRRLVTVGAQFAYWRDYAPEHRWRMFGKWHLLMPLVTLLCGYFPGKRLGWLEDTPTGVVRDWSTPAPRFERRPSGRALMEKAAPCPSTKSAHKPWQSASATIPTAPSRPSNACSPTSAMPRKPTCASNRKTSANNKSDISPFFAAHTKPHYGPSL